ncbi:hypothetical protein BH11VER1_BH11VER1_24400 [soil metagenome]
MKFLRTLHSVSRRIALVLWMACTTVAQAETQTPEAKLQIDKAVKAVGGADKLLTLFRIKEIFHSGETPDPAEGKKRSTRVSVIEPPLYWWLGTKDRAEEPAKFDVWAWTLGILTDPKSQIEVIPDIKDEGRTAFGLRVSGTVTPAMDLYFDTESNLLLRLDWRTDFYRFSEWKEHDGVKFASRTVIFKKATSKPWFYHNITEIERLKELPADLQRPALAPSKG